MTVVDVERGGEDMSPFRDVALKDDQSVGFVYG